MTKATAATVSSALITAGYLPTVSVMGDGTTYIVEARTVAGAAVDASVVATFASTNSVSAKVDMARFI